MVALHYSTLHRFDIFSVPGTIAHVSIRLPPNRWCRQYNRVMLNGYGNENDKKKKKSKRSNYQEKNNNFARAAHFLFHISLPLLLQCETSELNILWRKCRMCSQKTFAACVPVRLLFFHRCSFSPCWPLAFLIFSPSLYNFSVFLPKIFVSFVFLSRCSSLSLFFSLSFASLSPTFSFSLSFPFSTFQIRDHDN